MKTKLIALTLICALLLGGGCLAEEERPRLDTADRIVYRITNGKYRVMDLKGNFYGEDSEAFPSDQIGETAIYMAHGRYGYVAKDGTVLVEPNYLDLPTFEGGYAEVRWEDIDATERNEYAGIPGFPTYYGVIDAYGDLVVPTKYDFVRISRGGEYAVVSVSGNDFYLEGLFDLKQKKLMIEPKYYSLLDPHDGTAIACECTINRNPGKRSSDEYIYQYGIISVQDEVLIPFDYDRIDYNEGFNAYTCYANNEIAAIYEIHDGALTERAKS